MARVIGNQTVGPLVLSVSDPLASGGSDNPLLITATGAVVSTRDGIDGSSAVAWTIVNDGTIDAQANGVDLAGGGYLTNTGEILSQPAAASTEAVAIGGYGAVNNSGTIIDMSGNYGVAVALDSGVIVNTGVIKALTGLAVAMSSGMLVNTGYIDGGVVLGSGVIANAGQISSDIEGNGAVGVSLECGTVVNSGDIIRSIIGVLLGDGASFVNAATGFVDGTASSVSGGAGVSVVNAGTLLNGETGALSIGDDGQIVNAGTISGATGVLMGANADLVNAGLIIGAFGTAATIASGRLLNAGTIEGGITVEAGGHVTNTGMIGGGIEIRSGSATVVNNGTLSSASLFGSGAYSLSFDAGTTNNRLIVGAHAGFAGAVLAAAGSNSAIELAAGSGSISGIGAGQFDGFDRLTIDPRSVWTLEGSDAIGTVDVAVNGTVAIAGSFDVRTAVDPASRGVFEMLAGSTFEVASALGGGAQAIFAGASELVVDAASAFGHNVGTNAYTGLVLGNFGRGDRIDLKGFNFAGMTANYAASSGLLQLADATSKATLAFKDASLSMHSFDVRNDGAGGTLIAHS